MFGIFLFLTYYLQQLLGYSPIATGIAFLPMVASIALSASFSGAVLANRFSPRILVTSGLLVSALGMAFLTAIDVDCAYLTGILPGLGAVGLGLGFVFSSAMASSTAGARADDAGVVSATVNTAQQVGGSIGIVLLSSVAASAADNYSAEHAVSGDPAVVGAAARRGCGAGRLSLRVLGGRSIFAVGALVSMTLYRNEIPQQDADAGPVLVH